MSAVAWRPTREAGARAAGLAAVVAVLFGVACATTQEGRAGDGGEVAAALARLRPASEGPINATRAPLVFLAYRGPSGPELGAYDLAASRLVWKQPGELIGRIEVGRDVVVHAAKDGGGAGTVLIGRAVASGEILWRHEIAGADRLIGYAVDGDTAYYVVRAFASGGPRAAGAVVALDAITGKGRWLHELPAGEVGGPAARGGLVAIPVETQYVILLDGRDGREAARILSTEQAATFVRALPEGIFFGSKGIFRASAETATARRRSSGYAEAILPRFARATYDQDMYRPEQNDYSAIDRNRVVWRAAVDPGGQRMAFRDGLVFVHDFRFFFAFDAASGALRWAHAEPTADAVASEHTGTALVYVTADGELGALDALTGRRTFRARVPGATMVRGATFDAEGFHGGGVAVEPDAGDDLARTLSSILWDGDRRFTELAPFAIEELGHLPGRAVTADLLKAAQTPSLSAPARKKAEQALAARTDAPSTELFVEALGIRADYAEGRRPTSVAAIARATLSTRSKPVALALAAHLRLPETEPETAIEISRALAVSGAVESLSALRDFLCLYRGEPAYDADPAPLTAAADAVLALGGPADRQLLLFIADEPHTVEPLRVYLQRVLAQAVAQPAMTSP